MKVIFFGTPDYAVPVLDAIIHSKHEVVAVVSQPDRPKGRSNKPSPTPVKALALSHNIPVFQYERIRQDDVSELLNIEADIIVTCAYGQIIGANILFAKKFGVINLHGSLLPKYRGSSPIQWALINNEEKTGVTVLKSGIGMDDGEILMSREIDIEKDILQFRTVYRCGGLMMRNVDSDVEIDDECLEYVTLLIDVWLSSDSSIPLSEDNAFRLLAYSGKKPDLPILLKKKLFKKIK